MLGENVAQETKQFQLWLNQMLMHTKRFVLGYRRIEVFTWRTLVPGTWITFFRKEGDPSSQGKVSHVNGRHKFTKKLGKSLLSQEEDIPCTRNDGAEKPSLA